jgi:hypothetical protein
MSFSSHPRCSRAHCCSVLSTITSPDPVTTVTLTISSLSIFRLCLNLHTFNSSSPSTGLIVLLLHLVARSTLSRTLPPYPRTHLYLCKHLSTQRPDTGNPLMCHFSELLYLHYSAFCPPVITHSPSLSLCCTSSSIAPPLRLTCRNRSTQYVKYARIRENLSHSSGVATALESSSSLRCMARDLRRRMCPCSLTLLQSHSGGSAPPF